MKLRNSIIGLAVVATLAGCSAKGAMIPPDPAHWDTLKESVKKLSPDDQRLFTAYLMRESLGAAFNGGKTAIPPNTTIGAAINDQKKFEADATKAEADGQILKAKAAAERLKAEAALNGAATLSIVSMNFIPKDIYNSRYDDREQFIIAIQNKTQKDIAGIKGVVKFDDLFGSEIKSMHLAMDETIKAGQMATNSSYGFDINEFKSSDNQLRNADSTKLKITFHPEMIVFSDGSKLTVPSDSSS